MRQSRQERPLHSLDRPPTILALTRSMMTRSMSEVLHQLSRSMLALRLRGAYLRAVKSHVTTHSSPIQSNQLPPHRQPTTPTSTCPKLLQIPKATMEITKRPIAIHDNDKNRDISPKICSSTPSSASLNFRHRRSTGRRNTDCNEYGRRIAALPQALQAPTPAGFHADAIFGTALLAATTQPNPTQRIGQRVAQRLEEKREQPVHCDTTIGS
jgi:hypothetical protein